MSSPIWNMYAFHDDRQVPNERKTAPVSYQGEAETVICRHEDAPCCGCDDIDPYHEDEYYGGSSFEDDLADLYDDGPDEWDEDED